MNQYFDNNENLVSEIKENYVTVKDTNMYIYTDNGVFNKKGLDFSKPFDFERKTRLELAPLSNCISVL